VHGRRRVAIALRRSERLVQITKRLVESPGKTFSLNEFAAATGAAKSTISEDISIIKQTLNDTGTGHILTVPGPAGGVVYRACLSQEEQNRIITGLCEMLADPGRILPGGFLYMSDIASSPQILARIGEVFLNRFRGIEPDSVITVETIGIPVALMTARAFGVPLAIARRSGKMTEGTLVTMNYLSGSARRVETMSLPRRLLSSKQRVLVIDDFMKAGGTARGLVDLMHEFEVEVLGIGVLIEMAEPREKLVDDYLSLITLEKVDERNQEIVVRPT